MRLLIAIIALFVIGIWVFLAYFLMGEINIPHISLALPKSTESFSNSTTFLTGLLSSFSVILGLIAVLLQGKELKESTSAQRAQATALEKQSESQQKVLASQLDRSEAMVKQLEQQATANRILILQAKQQYDSSEVSRMDSILNQLKVKDIKTTNNLLFENCVAKKKVHIKSLKDIQNEMDKFQ
ncbi:MAG: hypothetical protein Q9M28_08650 [Mariprofundaceae bacterium]|nr:hypothetical protein [Mariprofundaceae bacterium]